MDEETQANVCRACLTENSDFQSIFVSDETSGLNIHLSEMIMAFASVQITFGDGLPEQICKQCADNTVKFYLFKSICEENDKILRERMGRSPLQLPDESNDGLFVDNKDIQICQGDMIVKPELVSEDSRQLVDTRNDPAVDAEPKTDDEIEVLPHFLDDIDDEFKCPTCSQVFATNSALTGHIKTHSILKQFGCTLCNKRFSRRDLLMRHNIAHAMKMDQEKIEFESFSDNGTDEDTIIIKTEEDLYPCSHCGVIFIKKDELERHSKDHLKKEVCRICNKKFMKIGQLNRHMKIHEDSKAHICQTCNKGFVRAEQLTNHMNMHSGVKPHVCHICFKGFNQISNLKDHMRTHNGEKPFLCSTCGKGFNQLGNLRQHTIRHSGIKAHLCSTCGNGFASKGELSAHLRKHTGARPFVCPICAHGFTTSSSLTKHKRIHSGEKPYECDVCNMKFSRSGILARHKRTHTGEKPYVCKFCTKAFSQSNDLTSHLRIHTGEKPYICDVCGQAFRQTSALKTHKKTHVERSIVLDNRTVMGVVHPTFMRTIEQN